MVVRSTTIKIKKGDRNMTLVQMQKNEDKNQKMMTVSERLPILDDEAVAYAISNENMAYLLGRMECRDGQYWYDSSAGITLQRVNAKTLRALTVVNDETPYRVLAMIKMTCKQLGIELQVDPYAVVMAYEPAEETEASPVEEPGLEVA
tara:strand:- start:213 stop:656 length:444 start_codon:yes stop_codon:yes gene_type:complete